MDPGLWKYEGGDSNLVNMSRQQVYALKEYVAAFFKISISTLYVRVGFFVSSYTGSHFFSLKFTNLQFSYLALFEKEINTNMTKIKVF